jgi:hypothetical protein
MHEVAETVDEARKLIEAGFEYVTEIDRVCPFRGRKYYLVGARSW